MKYIIGGGTSLIHRGSDGFSTYIYRFTVMEGEKEVIFTASTFPKVGDSIVNGVLVPLVGDSINNDTSKWKKFYGTDNPDLNHYDFM